MGITPLTTYLKKAAPKYVRTINPSTEGLETVALDGNQWMTAGLKTVMSRHFAALEDPFAEVSEEAEAELRKEWVAMAIRFTLCWLSAMIMPVWVIDGRAPVEKGGTHAKREETRKRARARYEQLKDEATTTTTRQEEEELDAEPEDEPETEWVMDDEGAEKDDRKRKAVSYRQQEQRLKQTWVAELRSVLLRLGVPVIQGLTEGEKVACMLWREGKVDGVFSNDTDCLVYGCTAPSVAAPSARPRQRPWRSTTLEHILGS